MGLEAFERRSISNYVKRKITNTFINLINTPDIIVEILPIISGAFQL